MMSEISVIRRWFDSVFGERKVVPDGMYTVPIDGKVWDVWIEDDRIYLIDETVQRS